MPFGSGFRLERRFPRSFGLCSCRDRSKPPEQNCTGRNGTFTYQSARGTVRLRGISSNTRCTSCNLQSDTDSGFWNVYSTNPAWPTNDQFTSYPDTPPWAAAIQPALTTREGVVNAATFESRGGLRIVDLALWRQPISSDGGLEYGRCCFMVNRRHP